MLAVTGGGAKYMVAVLEQFSFSLGSYTRKRIFPVHIITNGKGFFKYAIIYMQTHFPHTHYHKYSAHD